jgi:hypothetical protein
METIYERAAGLDVNKDTVVACVRVLDGREVSEELAEFGTTTPELLALRDWLTAQHPQVIGMESTEWTGSRWCAVRRSCLRHSHKAALTTRHGNCQATAVGARRIAPSLGCACGHWCLGWTRPPA